MRRIDIKITFRCNNCCKFCVQGEKRSLYSDKTIEEIKKNLGYSKSRYEEVVFTGGDPTVRSDFLDLVSYAKNLGYTIQVQTNGRKFSDINFCKDAVKAGVDTFAVSIHGHTAKLHDYLTGVSGSFEQSLSGIKNLIPLGKIVVTNTVITKLNYRFLPKIAHLLVGLGILQYQFAFPHILGKAFRNLKLIVPRKKEIMPYVKIGLDIGRKNKRLAKTEAIPYCFLKGYEDCVAEKDSPETRVFDIYIVENFISWRKESGKSKGPKCKQCVYYESCEGPWREYPQIFGWEEFQPVKNKSTK